MSKGSKRRIGEDRKKLDKNWDEIDWSSTRNKKGKNNVRKQK